MKETGYIRVMSRTSLRLQHPWYGPNHTCDGRSSSSLLDRNFTTERFRQPFLPLSRTSQQGRKALSSNSLRRHPKRLISRRLGHLVTVFVELGAALADARYCRPSATGNDN